MAGEEEDAKPAFALGSLLTGFPGQPKSPNKGNCSIMRNRQLDSTKRQSQALPAAAGTPSGSLLAPRGEVAVEQAKARKTAAGTSLPRTVWAVPGPESETVAPGRTPGLALQHWSVKALTGGIAKGCPCILDAGYGMV